MYLGKIYVFLLIFSLSCGKRIKWPIHQTAQNISNLNGDIISGISVSVNIGSPPQTFNVILDTGSSNFAIAGSANPSIKKFYNRTASHTAVSSKTPVKASYTIGSWEGLLLYDYLSIPSAGLSNPVFIPITEITKSKDFFVNGSDWQGIMGLAYSKLVVPYNRGIPSPIKSITSSSISDIFSLQICSTTNSDAVTGQFLIGEIDSSLAVGPFHWTPIVKEEYYNVLLVGLMVGDEVVDVPCSQLNDDKSIVDSGTTNLRFPQKVFTNLVHLINNSVAGHYFGDNFYLSPEVACMYEDIRSLFPTITVLLPSLHYNRTISLIIYPESYIQSINVGTGGRYCYKFAIYPSNTGTVLGTVLMEQYYVVFDREKSRIGFAQSVCAKVGSSLGIEIGLRNSTVCEPPTSSANQFTLLVIGIIVFSLLFVVLCGCIIFKFYRRRARPQAQYASVPPRY